MTRSARRASLVSVFQTRGWIFSPKNVMSGLSTPLHPRSLENSALAEATQDLLDRRRLLAGGSTLALGGELPSELDDAPLLAKAAVSPQ